MAARAMSTNDDAASPRNESQLPQQNAETTSYLNHSEEAVVSVTENSEKETSSKKNSSKEYSDATQPHPSVSIPQQTPTPTITATNSSSSFKTPDSQATYISQPTAPSPLSASSSQQTTTATTATSATTPHKMTFKKKKAGSTHSLTDASVSSPLASPQMPQPTASVSPTRNNLKPALNGTHKQLSVSPTNRTTSALSSSTVFRDTSPQQPQQSSSLFPYLYSQPKQQSGSTNTQQATASSFTSYMFRSLSTASSSSSLDSLIGQTNNQSGYASDADSFMSDTHKKPVSVPEHVQESNGTADDDEDALLLSRLDRHMKQGTQPITIRVSTNTSPSGQTSTTSVSNTATITTTTSKWIASQLQSSFQLVRDSVMGATSPTSPIAPDSDPIDWDYWGKIINNYDMHIRSNPREFTRKLHKGIPQPIRGMIWQLMTNSKSESLETEYHALLLRHTRHDKPIQRDLSRTFPQHPYFKDPDGPGQQSLYNVLKAYSIYDQEIGYCQGIAFIVGPLLLNMPEEQAFSVLVRFMFDYAYRDIYSPRMIGIQLRCHQFDKLMEMTCPTVYSHLCNQDIRSTMYATQWFMTVFAYRFPLDMVFRILDIVFAEGGESVLRFAISLIKTNSEKITTLEFESLLEFLKSGLFDVYVGDMNRLVKDASGVRVPKHKLDLWTKEFHELMRKQSPEVMEAETARTETRRWIDAYKKLETNYEVLNREHIDLANRMVEKDVESEKTSEMVETLKAQIDGLKMVMAEDRKYAEEEVKSEMSALVAKNHELSQKNAKLQEEISDLETELMDTKMRLANSQMENEDLKRRLDTMRRALGSQ